MDTGTHLVMGVGIAGLAHLDPVVAADPTLAFAVFIGAVAGQQAPDLDTIVRLKGNAVYIKNHRGLSHSIPAIFLWTLLITAVLSLFFRSVPIWHAAFWVFAAVAIHVFSDMFNAYGTQSLRPFTRKWVAWNIIHIFDPFIFISHVIAISAWALQLAKPGVIFGVLYAFLLIYYIWRSILHHRLEKKLPVLDKGNADGDKYMLIPTVQPNKWNVLKHRKDNSFMLGELRGGWLHWVDRVRCDDHPAIDASRHHPDIAAFLSFTSFVCAELRRHDWGYEVRWADVRARHRKNYPFVAVLLLDHELNPIESYVGWISESRMEKRLGISTIS